MSELSKQSRPNHSVIIEREMPHPPEKVWRALTQGPLIEQWLLANDFQPVVGHKFTLRNKPIPQWNGLIDCEVLTLEPYRQLSYSWSALGLHSIVTWTLTETIAGTQLRMEQSGFPSLKSPSYKGANRGWQGFITALERVLIELN